ncbi:bifunctional demethylmenaquinone methyltransferase/2-methoxy-6-polyprenyl-1,4-benzoquinol methylase UbiE [Immundisolibacter sp.]|uniref:bifunctional demethylmenaquinone methyltransferase/2-methoxy-6-polyprenyl-1,4-benzoquinol methylase UbiE n=1 Tax=Immundisolibacter sp. TaxID=1934948 RepID=UPI00261032D1|nr:bifunctional demethylmenaquinone methyltransferase/2-methoxy-6-polyprenyl-1,4-benzoquinol methylase UbiE [Immundisolibacter sp.]MDD3652005.1 bifunctional demethylmenaquinone methyltransferase/2-methoxy-6-polyprenyl-1,4-benzoquinol methylase UbiE [Immundisolibacter sp.]
MEHDTTDFGFSEVPVAEKARRVRQVFDSVAPRYDLMNDLMSLGLHRVWKHLAVELAAVRPGERVLDLAGGTGDLTRLLAPRVGSAGRVLLADINGAMLARGRDRLLDAGVAGNVDFLQLDAERLPLADQSLDCVVIGFGLRNVTDKQAALCEMHRVLKPGGRALVLEFSRPVLPGLKPLYDAYSFQVLPRLGRLVAGDAASYRYLAESIRRHPDQDTLLSMLHAAGFERCQYFNFTGGIVAVHRGYRL